jgi:hypothetical protein
VSTAKTVRVAVGAGEDEKGEYIEYVEAPLATPPAPHVEPRLRLPWENIRPGALINIEGMAFRVHKITKKNLVLRPLGLVREKAREKNTT